MEGAVHLEIKIWVTSVGKSYKTADIFTQTKGEGECVREK